MIPVLSLFPGLGLLDYAFELEGFTVYRGPDVIWGGDIRTFHPVPGIMRGVIGGPPCQSFSSLVHLVRANGYEPKFGNLIPEYERCVTEAAPDWFLMENVPQAPEPVVPGYGVTSFLLDNSHLAGEDGFGQEQKRVRRFSFGMRGVEKPPNLMRWIDLAVFFLPDADGTMTQYTPDNSQEAKTRKRAIVGDLRETALQIGGSGKLKPQCRKQTVCSKDEHVPVKIGGSGKVKRTRHETLSGGHDKPPSRRDKDNSVGRLCKAVSSSAGGRAEDGTLNSRRYRLADALRLQGLPADFLDHCPMTAEGKLKAVANGVPVMMGRAIARAVKEAVQESTAATKP